MVVSQLCVNCESGKFSSEDNSPSCSGCAAGKYLSNTAATEESSACSSCDAGKYSGASSTSCTSCDGGKYLTNAVTDDESSACTNCGTGQYSGTASASCSDFAAGKYLDYPATGVESSACKDCQAGTYSELPVPTRALDCSQCSDGKYSGLGSPSCTSCAAGKNVANSEISVESTAFNTLIFAMVGVGILGKPLTKALKKMQRVHLHNSSLKGVEDCVEVDSFVDYFRRLAESSDEEAGWMRLDLKHWGGKRKEAEEWLDETGAVADWRSRSGEGPVDQARVKFRIEVDVEGAVAYTTSIKNRHSKSAGSFLYVIDKGKDWRQVYRAVKMPWPLRQRNFVYTEHVRRAGEEVIVCSRSSSELNDTTSAELSWKEGRRRTEMKLGRYLFRPCRDGGTEVVFCVDVDLGGWFAIDYFHRKVAPSYLKGVVDEYRAFSERWLASRVSGDADFDPPPPVPLIAKAVSMRRRRGSGVRVDDQSAVCGLRRGGGQRGG